MNNKIIGQAIAFARGVGAGLVVGSVLLFIIVGVMLYSSKANACDDVYLGAWSKHIHDDRELNETHYLLACTKIGYITGIMKNSHGDPAIMAGKSYNLFESKYFESNIYMGATYGYYGCDNNDLKDHVTLCPMIVPEISYTKYRIQPTLVLLGNAAAVTFKVLL